MTVRWQPNLILHAAGSDCPYEGRSATGRLVGASRGANSSLNEGARGLLRGDGGRRSV